MAKLVVYDAQGNFYPTGYFNIVTNLVEKKTNYDKFLDNSNKKELLGWLVQFADGNADTTNPHPNPNIVIKHIAMSGNTEVEQVAIGKGHNRNCVIKANVDVRDPQTNPDENDDTKVSHANITLPANQAQFTGNVADYGYLTRYLDAVLAVFLTPVKDAQGNVIGYNAKAADPAAQQQLKYTAMKLLFGFMLITRCR